MNPPTDHEVACRRVAALYRPRWLRAYVSAKLRTDPTFPAAFALFADSDAPILDIGCGIGLLAAYLRERGCGQPLVGVDRDVRKLALASDMVAAGNYRGVEFRADDVGRAIPDVDGDIALFDVLHYLPSAEQNALLSRIRSQLRRGRVVAIRDALRDETMRFMLTCAAEKFAQMVSWNVSGRLQFPTAQAMRAVFPAVDFAAQIRPLWGRTPFNNHLLTFRRL